MHYNVVPRYQLRRNLPHRVPLHFVFSFRQMPHQPADTVASPFKSTHRRLPDQPRRAADENPQHGKILLCHPERSVIFRARKITCSRRTPCFLQPVPQDRGILPVTSPRSARYNQNQPATRLAAACGQMTTIREQIATNVLTVTKFRDLLRTMRENRPNDDLEIVRKAYEFSQ